MIYATDEDWAAWKDAANLTGRSISAFIRARLVADIPERIRAIEETVQREPKKGK